MSTINVNLKRCDCNEEPGRLKPLGSTHAWDCAGLVVPIPCPIQRSVFFEVRLGECTTPVACSVVNTHGQVKVFHLGSCPARTIRVSCSISGKTWEESEVTECASVRDEHGRLAAPSYATPMEYDAALSACRDRWALVKALVLGSSNFVPGIDSGQQSILMLERDAVYARLAAMRRHEEALYAEWLALPDTVKRRCQIAPDAPEYARTSAQDALECYVAGLIEQVGTL